MKLSLFLQTVLIFHIMLKNLSRWEQQSVFLPWDQEHLENQEGQQIQWDPEIEAEISLK